MRIINRLIRASNVGLVLRFIGDSCIEKTIESSAVSN